MKENKLSLITRIKISSGMFGGMYGAGYASGATIVSFWLMRAGYLSVFTCLLSTALIVLYYYWSLETCRLYDLHDIRSLYELLYGKQKRFIGLMDITVVVYQLAGLIFVFSGTGSLFAELFGISPYVSAAVMVVLCMIITAFGTEIFNNVSGICVSAIMLICIVGYVIALINGGFSGVVHNFSIHWMPEGVNVFSAIWYLFGGSVGFIYMSSVYILSTDGHLKTHKDVTATLRIGWLLILIGVWLPCFAILGFSPDSLGANIITLDIFKKSVPGASGIYSLLLGIALLSTGVSMFMALANRFEKVLPQSIKSQRTRNFIIQIIVSAVCFVTSRYGLTTMAMLCSNVLPPFAIITLLIPLVLRAPKLIREGRKKEIEEI